MTLLLKLLATILVAVVLGVGSALWVTDDGRQSGDTTTGPWHIQSRNAGEAANPYGRARVARDGILSFSYSEKIDFTAVTSDDGTDLVSTCRYVVKTPALPARQWSIAVYGEDNYLIPNRLDRYSYSAASATRERDGSYLIQIGGERLRGNWIPTGVRPQKFTLMLQLYSPDEAARSDPGKLLLPPITKGACS